MNIDFLQKEIIPQRDKEISEGKNSATSQPIYVVLDLCENFVSGHSDFTSITNNKGRKMEFGYIDESLEPEDREFSSSDENMISPIDVTRFYTDRIIAFFLTNKGAHEYLEYQKHNLNAGYVYVFHSGYRNAEMDELLGGK